MKFSKDFAGALVVPAIACAYAIYAIWELNSGNYRPVTVTYTHIITIPILVLGLVVVVMACLRGDKPENIGGETEAERAAVVWKGRGKRLILVVAATFALVVTMPWVGYVFGFFLYVTAVLWVMNVRKISAILILSLSMTAIVHFVFADVLDQDFPQGILEPLFTMLEGD
jgi:hypothetical protein